MAIIDDAGMGRFDSGASALAESFLAAPDPDSFDKLWRADPEAARQAIGELAEQAAKAGRTDLVENLARMAGGVDRLILMAPQLLDALVARDDAEAVEGLMSRAPFAWSRGRASKSKPPRWEADLVAAAIALNALAALEDAIAEGVLCTSFFQSAELDFQQSLMFAARGAGAVDFLASHGLSIAYRDEAGRSALSEALARAQGQEEGSDLAQCALRMAQRAQYDDALSADLLEGALDKPSILEAGLGAGANPEALLPGNKGAMRAAVERGHSQSALLLAKAGADPFAPDRDGLAAHDAAGLAGKAELAKEMTAARAAQDAVAAVAARKERARTLSIRQ